VSGAAAAPGAGSYTSRGWALLLYFLGVRLGYWMAAPDVPSADGEALRRPLSGWRHFVWSLAVKPAMLWSEGTATFFGTARPWWYLSDGGHFDNTGIWPLLKRRADFIIAADCGADADYEYADLENLVRKARIDFGCEIDFYTSDEARALLGLRTDGITVLSPEDMANNHSARGVLLARVRYAAQGDDPARDATLLIVKPSLHDALDVDLLAYAQRHPDFPHESTGDQSFDEAQWDGYHRLGEDVGRRFDGLWLAQLPGWRRVRATQSPGLPRGATGLLPHPLKVGARLKAAAAAPGDERRAADGTPLWRRAPRTAAIGATLGLTASGTLALSMYQVFDQMQKAREAERKEVQALVQRVEDLFKNYTPDCPRIEPTAVTPFLVLNAVKDRQQLSAIENDSIRRITGRVLQACPTVQAEAAARRSPVTQSAAPTPQAMQGTARAGTGQVAGTGGNTCPPVTSLDAASHLQVCNVLDVRSGISDALNYWFPVVAPDNLFEQRIRSVRNAIADPAAGGLAARIEKGLAAARDDTPHHDCSNPATVDQLRETVLQMCADKSLAPPIDNATGPRGPGRAAVPAVNCAAQLLGLVAPASGCTQPSLLTLRTLVLDDASRRDANRLLDELQAKSGEVFIAAPVQDVVQFAVLKQTRAPVPWPQPTLIVHRGEDDYDNRCAEVLKPWLACRLRQPDGEPSKPWVRQLPKSGVERARVIELWLPAVTPLTERLPATP
jgi:hypothetical protein